MNEADVLKMLSESAVEGQVPYHYAFESIRQSLLLQDPGFVKLYAYSHPINSSKNLPSVIKLAANVSPTLMDFLLKDILRQTEEEFLKSAKVNVLTQLTPFTPVNILDIVKKSNAFLEFNQGGLQTIFSMNYAMQRYGITVDEAILLYVYDISQL